MNVANYGLERGYVLDPCNVEATEKVVHLPIYFAGLFENR